MPPRETTPRAPHLGFVDPGQQRPPYSPDGPAVQAQWIPAPVTVGLLPPASTQLQSCFAEPGCGIPGWFRRHCGDIYSHAMLAYMLGSSCWHAYVHCSHIGFHCASWTMSSTRERDPLPYRQGASVHALDILHDIFHFLQPFPYYQPPPYFIGPGFPPGGPQWASPQQGPFFVPQPYGPYMGPSFPRAMPHSAAGPPGFLSTGA